MPAKFYPVSETDCQKCHETHSNFNRDIRACEFGPDKKFTTKRSALSVHPIARHFRVHRSVLSARVGFTFPVRRVPVFHFHTPHTQHAPTLGTSCETCTRGGCTMCRGKVIDGRCVDCDRPVCFVTIDTCKGLSQGQTHLQLAVSRLTIASRVRRTPSKHWSAPPTGPPLRTPGLSALAVQLVCGRTSVWFDLKSTSPTPCPDEHCVECSSDGTCVKCQPNDVV